MKIYLGIVLFVLAACSSSNTGDSGIDQSKKANSLSSSEVQMFCQWSLAAQGGAGHTTTCDGFTSTVQSEAQCETNYSTLMASCTVTVGGAEDCVHALVAAPCSFGGTTCQALIACSTSIMPASSAGPMPPKS